jgi:hypothetical protein
MRIGNKIFPYPIINSQKNLSSYESSKFELKTEIEQTDEKCILKDIHYELNNDQLNRLIQENKIGVYCLIECGSTVYRKLFPISTQPSNIEIELAKLRDNVTVSVFGVAKQPLYNFIDDDFVVDYHGYAFNIDEHDILLADDGFRFNVDYDENQDNKISSIFLVIRDDGIADETFNVESNEKKICIYLPTLQYERYEGLKDIDYFKNLFFSILLIPALVSELNKIRDQFNAAEYDLDDIEDEYKWFRAIIKQYKQVFSEEFTIDKLRDLDLLILSQRLINMPVTKGIDEIYNIRGQGGEDYEDD